MAHYSKAKAEWMLASEENIVNEMLSLHLTSEHVSNIISILTAAYNDTTVSLFKLSLTQDLEKFGDEDDLGSYYLAYVAKTYPELIDWVEVANNWHNDSLVEWAINHDLLDWETVVILDSDPVEKARSHKKDIKNWDKILIECIILLSEQEFYTLLSICGDIKLSFRNIYNKASEKIANHYLRKDAKLKALINLKQIKACI